MQNDGGGPGRAVGHLPSRRRFVGAGVTVGLGGALGLTIADALAPIVVPERPFFEPNTSFWSQALPAPNGPLIGDQAADVVVIGGGFTGLSSSYYLRMALPGSRVILLEAATCGNGASGRNGAMLLNQTDETFMRPSGDPALGRRLYSLTRDNISRLHDLSITTGVDFDLEVTGALQVSNSIEDAEAAERAVQEMRGQGLPFEYWSKARTASAIGTAAYEGAIFDPGSGQVHPGKLVRMWKAAAEHAGAFIFDHSEVVSITEGTVHTLTLANGSKVRAPILVLATNAFTSKLGYLRHAVVPVYDYVGITPRLSKTQLDSVRWTSRMPFNDSRTEVFYAGLTLDGRIHIGGGPVDYGFNNGVRRPVQAQRRFEGLLRELIRLFPSLDGVGFEFTWGGAVDMSLDQSPAVGQMGRNRNILYAVGFSGHGVNLSSVFGRVIADLAAGRRADWAWLPYLDRLPPYIPNEPWRWMGLRSALGVTRMMED